MPDTYPAFSDIIEAEDGHLWVLRSIMPSESELDVFDPDGRYLGAITSNLSALTHPFIDSSYLVGVSVDSLDVQYVEVYRVINRRSPRLGTLVGTKRLGGPYRF